MNFKLKLKTQQAKLFKRFLGTVIAAFLAVFTHFHLIGDGDVLAADYVTDLTDVWLAIASHQPALISANKASLPELKTHSLPPTLAQWQDPQNSGDYFSQVKPTKVGYLVWSKFPVKVYVEPPANSSELSYEVSRAKEWTNAVLKAVQEWNVYLPLAIVEQPEIADIKVMRSLPPLQPTINRNTGQFTLPRARSAETRYELYISQQPDAANTLAHRYTINLSPNQTAQYIQAASRHELGHALGIWGHSPVERDTMYFSQVRNPPQISPRDINTLKIVYEQPTRLGWSLP